MLNGRGLYLLVFRKGTEHAEDWCGLRLGGAVAVRILAGDPAKGRLAELRARPWEPPLFTAGPNQYEERLTITASLDVSYRRTRPRLRNHAHRRRRNVVLRYAESAHRCARTGNRQGDLEV